MSISCPCFVGLALLGAGDEVLGVVSKWAWKGQVDTWAAHLHEVGLGLVVLKISQVIPRHSQGWGPLASSPVPHICYAMSPQC